MAKIKAKKAVEETTAKAKKVKKSKTKVIKDTSFNENNSEIGKFIIIFVSRGPTFYFFKKIMVLFIWVYITWSVSTNGTTLR